MKLTVLQYITPSRLGGAEDCFLRVVEHQRALGHRVIVVTKRDTPLRPLLEKLNVEVYGWFTRGKIDPVTLSRLCRLIRRERVDIVHTHLTTASWMGSLAGKITRVPVVAHVHAADNKTWFQRADYLVAVARGVKRHLIAQGIAASRIPVIYYGIDLQKYDQPLARDEAKARLGLPPGAKTVGVVASLQERKGHRFLLEAIKKIEPQTGPVYALFAGEGPEEDALRTLARELNIEKQVYFLGFRGDVREVVSACDVFCLPSRKEGLSIAVMEAMALRCPVIATDIAGMAEVVQNGETGLLVPPFEVEPLGSALAQILNDEALAARLTQNGRRFLEEHFEQDACLGRLEVFQQEVVAAWRKGGKFNCSALENSDESEP